MRDQEFNCASDDMLLRALVTRKTFIDLNNFISLPRATDSFYTIKIPRFRKQLLASANPDT